VQVKELIARGIAVEFDKESLKFSGADSPMANLLQTRSEPWHNVDPYRYQVDPTMMGLQRLADKDRRLLSPPILSSLHRDRYVRGNCDG